jgi:hypothetical protein
MNPVCHIEPTTTMTETLYIPAFFMLRMVPAVATHRKEIIDITSVNKEWRVHREKLLLLHTIVDKWPQLWSDVEALWGLSNERLERLPQLLKYWKQVEPTPLTWIFPPMWYTHPSTCVPVSIDSIVPFMENLADYNLTQNRTPTSPTLYANFAMAGFVCEFMTMYHDPDYKAERLIKALADNRVYNFAYEVQCDTIEDFFHMAPKSAFDETIQWLWDLNRMLFLMFPTHDSYNTYDELAMSPMDKLFWSIQLHMMINVLYLPWAKAVDSNIGDLYKWREICRGFLDRIDDGRGGDRRDEDVEWLHCRALECLGCMWEVEQLHYSTDDLVYIRRLFNE